MMKLLINASQWKPLLWLLVLVLFSGASAMGGTEKRKVINIEAAMRAWQERSSMVYSSPAYWPPNKEKIDAGVYPKDGFYGWDLLDEDFAASLVETLYYEMMSANYTFIIGGPKEDLDYEDYHSVPDYAVIDRNNYKTVFTELVNYMHGLGMAELDTSSNSTTHQFGTGKGTVPADAIAQVVASFAEVPDPKSPSSPSGTTATTDENYMYGGGGIYYKQFLNRKWVDPTNGWDSFREFMTWRHLGQVSVDARRWKGTVTLYMSVAESLTRYNQEIGFFPIPGSAITSSETTVVEPFHSITSFSGGSIYGHTQVFGPDESEALDFDIEVEPPPPQDGLSIYAVARSKVWKFKAFVNPVFTRRVDELFVTLECPCSACIAGEIKTENECVHVTMGLGQSSGESAGTLYIDEELRADTLASPAHLKLRGNGDAEPVYASLPGGQYIRQISAPQALVDVVIIDEFSYEIRFYKKTQQGPLTSGGIFEVTGSPYRVVTIANPDQTLPLNKVRVLLTAGASTLSQTLYLWDDVANNWAMTEGTGAKQRIVKRITEPSPGPGLRKETIIETDEAENVLSKRTLTFKAYAWNIAPLSANKDELIEEVIDPDGEALTSTYDYYETTDEVSGAYTARLKSKIEPSGYWEKYYYYNGGHTEYVTSPWGNTAFGATAGIRFRKSYKTGPDQDYTRYSEGIIDAGGAVHVTKLEHRVHDYDQTIIQHAIDADADLDDPANLKTINTYYNQWYPNPEFAGREVRDVKPDGTGRVTIYRRVTSGIEATVYEGALTSAYKAINMPGFPADSVIANDGTVLFSGTKTVTVTNDTGEMISETVYDVPSGQVLRFSEATAFDDFGRVTIRDYSDGTHEQFQYGCCGLEYSVDREGIRTDFYYDDFRQLESTKRAGITTKTFTEFVDDKLNHVTVRLGTDDSPVEQRREVRDLAGRILSVIEQGGTTLFAEAVLPTGEIVKTTTYPDGGTRIETYARDGRLTEVAGTAVAHVKYEENVSSLYWFGDYHTREIKVGDDNEETEWVMTFPDLLGRPLYTVNADTYGAPGNHTYIDYSYAESLDPKVIRVSDEDGFQKVYSYNERGELSEQASDLDWSSEIEHDGIDRVTRITRSVTTRDGGTPVQRTTVEGWPEEEVDAPLQLSQTDISLDGLTTWRTEAGATTKAVTTYGPVAGTRTVTVTYPDNTSLARVFLNGRLQSETRRDSAAQTMTALTYGYDEHGRLETVTDALGRITTTSYYPGTDRAHTVTTPDPDSTRSGSGYDAQTTTYGYDEAGRVNSVQAHDGSLTHTTYWPSGQVKRVWGGRTYPQEYTYDSQGRVKTLTTWQDFAGDTRKATTTWNYNALRGWLDNKRYADGHGPSYTYWTSGRPDTRQWARTHNGQPLVTTYDYNDAGDLKEIAYSDDTPLVSLTYDRLGRLHTTTDAAGLLTRSYDPVSLRLEGEAYSGTGLLSGRSITRGYDSLNRLESVVTDTGHAVDYDYNNAGRLDAINHGIHSAKYTYKAGVGSVETVTVKRSGADRVKHERITDALGRVGQVKTVTLGNAAVQRDYTYNHANQRTRIEQEDTRRWAFGHDDLGQVISAEKRLADNTTPLPGYSFGYTFDTIGNRTATAVNGRPATYLRDAGFLNQYTSRTVPGVVDVRGEAYADAMITVNSVAAARTGKDFYKEVSVSNGSAAVNTAITIEAVIAGTPPESVTEVRTAFSAQATESFTHDDDGNLTSDGRWSYTWDAENRLFAMETVAAVAAALPTLKQRLEFSYDAQGRRIHKLVKLWNASTSTWTTSAGQRFLYDGWNLITETDALNSTVLRTHVWGLDLSETAQGAGGVGGLLWSSAGGSTFAASSDANGNIVAYVNTATVIVAGRADYGAFGEAVMRTGVANTLPFGFSTKYIDNETDMLYYGLRYYNPSIGRWLSRDPIEENGGVNLYGMIGNNPVNYLDYLGLQERSPFCDCILKSFVENSSLWSLASNRVMQIEEAYENTLNQIKNGLRDPSQIKLALLTNGSVPILTRVDGSIVDAASVADALLKLTGNPAEKFGSMVGYQSLAVDSGNLAIDIANGDPSASLSAVKVGYTVGTSAFTGIIFREATAALGMSRGSVMTGIVALPLAGFGFGIDALRDDYSYNSAVKTLNGVKSRALYELKLQVQIYSSATERDMRYLKRYNCLPE